MGIVELYASEHIFMKKLKSQVNYSKNFKKNYIYMSKTIVKY